MARLRQSPEPVPVSLTDAAHLCRKLRLPGGSTTRGGALLGSRTGSLTVHLPRAASPLVLLASPRLRFGPLGDPHRRERDVEALAGQLSDGDVCRRRLVGGVRIDVACVLVESHGGEDEESGGGEGLGRRQGHGGEGKEGLVGALRQGGAHLG